MVTGLVIDRVGPDLKAGIVGGQAELVGDVAVIEIDADGAETKGRGYGAVRGVRRLTVGGRRARAVIEQEMDIRGEPSDFTGPGGGAAGDDDAVLYAGTPDDVDYRWGGGVGRAIEGGVMRQHGDSIPAEAAIQLDDINSECEGLGNGGSGVFGSLV